jgi:hypothetical protein
LGTDKPCAGLLIHLGTDELFDKAVGRGKGLIPSQRQDAYVQTVRRPKIIGVKEGDQVARRRGCSGISCAGYALLGLTDEIDA